jgi:hypothetical protein
VPSDWTAEPFVEGVKVARGAAYYLVTYGSAEGFVRGRKSAEGVKSELDVVRG